MDDFLFVSFSILNRTERFQFRRDGPSARNLYIKFSIGYGWERIFGGNGGSTLHIELVSSNE